MVNQGMHFLKKVLFYFLAFYDKRMVEKCLIHTTPIGFFKIKEDPENYTCYKCKVDGKYYDKCKKLNK